MSVRMEKNEEWRVGGHNGKDKEGDVQRETENESGIEKERGKKAGERQVRLCGTR